MKKSSRLLLVGSSVLPILLAATNAYLLISTEIPPEGHCLEACG
jgi:hypothetical protein